MKIRRLLALSICSLGLGLLPSQWVLAQTTFVQPEIPTDEVTLPQVGAEMFPVPPVVDRPIGEEEGDRLFVSKFRLKGVTERTEHGIINVEELQGIIEKARLETQGLTEVGEDGFSEGERKEIADFMRNVIDDPDWDNKLPDYEALVDRLRQEKRERLSGMTIGQMQNIANAVTEYYRRAGFVLAQAFIPQQEIAEGVVTIEVIEGTLSSVLAEGNKTFTDKLLAAPFKKLIDAPVTAGQVETALLLLGDLPGLSVFGVFQPGATTGTTDMLLRVQEEDKWEGTVRYDNQGSRFTGEDRILASATLNNITRTGDRFTVTGLQTYDPKNSFFGSFEYERPMFIPGLTATANYSRNFFDLGAEIKDQNLSGVVKNFSVAFKQAVIRSRTKNLYAQLGIARKQLVNQSSKAVLSRDNLSMLEGQVNFDSINPESSSINLASFGFSVGLDDLFGGMGGQEEVEARATPPSRQGQLGKFATNKFQKYNASYTRLQTIYPTLSALLRLEGQWSPAILSPLEEYAIGGATNVRAFAPSEFLVDSAMFASIELTADAPGFSDVISPIRNLNWGQLLHVSFFTDYAMGTRHSPLNEEAAISVGGYGFGLAFTVPGEFTARVQASKPTSVHRDKPTDKENFPNDGHATQWWFDLTYDF